jgi:hypothetical protein
MPPLFPRQFMAAFRSRFVNQGGFFMRGILAFVVWLACSLPALGENPEIPASDGDPAERVAALRRAATHLDVAGLPDEAARVRNAAEELVRRLRAAQRELLERKLAELEALKAEMARLEQLSSPGRQIRTDIQIVQIDRASLREMGLDVRGAEPAPGYEANEILDTRSGEVVVEMLALLRRHGLAKVLAEPTLVSVSGREARFRSGGERSSGGPSPTETQWNGTELRITATEMQDGRIHLDGSLELVTTIPDGRQPGVGTPRHVHVPRFTIEQQSGSTIVFAPERAGKVTFANPIPDSDGVATIVLLTTESLHIAEQTAAYLPETPSSPKRRIPR